MTPDEAQSLEQAMLQEVSEGAARMTISDKTARNWLRKLGFKFRTKVTTTILTRL